MKWLSGSVSGGSVLQAGMQSHSQVKGGLFSESAIHFSNLPISKEKIFQKNYPELKI